MAQVVWMMIGCIGGMKKVGGNGTSRENPRIRCLSTTKPSWHEQGSIRRRLAPEVSALPTDPPRRLFKIYEDEDVG